MSNLSQLLTIKLWEEIEFDQYSSKSKRNWEIEEQKLRELQALPPLSRTDPSNINVKSLRDLDLQQQFWDYIMNRIWNLDKPECKESWEPIVYDFRKLREGIVASYWSNGDIGFAIQVFEWSVNAALKAQNFEEMFKCLRGLVDELYPLKDSAKKTYFTVLDTLYFCCYLKDMKVVINRLELMKDIDTKETKFVKMLIHCIFVSENPLKYFELYQHAPYLTYKVIMEHYHDTIRARAIRTLRKAYLSVSLEWAKYWLGLEQEVDVVPCINKLMPCIDRVDVDRQIVYFIKSVRKKPVAVNDAQETSTASPEMAATSTVQAAKPRTTPNSPIASFTESSTRESPERSYASPTMNTPQQQKVPSMPSLTTRNNKVVNEPVMMTDSEKIALYEKKM
ncbi:hypothetical protein RMATCC62417_09179 [Rhizopus microsporus]|nr:hypothetical protein RMATCC62417_09179 [Rhizopus microsporus]